MGNFYATNICTKIVYLCRIVEQLGPNYIRNKRHIYSKVLCALSLFAQFSLNKSNFSLVTLFRSKFICSHFSSVGRVRRTNQFVSSVLAIATNDDTSHWWLYLSVDCIFSTHTQTPAHFVAAEAIVGRWSWSIDAKCLSLSVIIFY